MDDPRLIQGGMAVDDRGTVRFVNDFDFQAAGIRRLYWMENHQVGFVRAWHGHEREAKYVLVASGTALVCIVPVTTFKEKVGHVFRYILSASNPSILYIPAGYANGTKALVPNTQIVHFSTLTLDESKGDDFRWPWNELGEELWQTVQR